MANQEENWLQTTRDWEWDIVSKADPVKSPDKHLIESITQEAIPFLG